MKSLVVGLLAAVIGSTTVSAQSAAPAAPVRIKLRIPANVDVRAYAPDSARFSLDGAEPIARRDTLVLRDGAALSYDRTSGPIHFLVRGLKSGETVDFTANGVRNSRWTAFVTHDIAIVGRGESLQTASMVSPIVVGTEPNR